MNLTAVKSYYYGTCLERGKVRTVAARVACKSSVHDGLHLRCFKVTNAL